MFRFRRVPAGAGELRLEAWDAPTTTLATIDVPAGGEVRVELP